MNQCWRPRGALLTAAENLRAQPTLQSPTPPLLQCACVPVFLARCVSLLYDVVRVRANPLSQEHVCVTPATLIFHLHLETVHDASQSPDPETRGKNMCYQYSLNIKIVTLLCKGKAHNFCFTNNGMERMLYVMDNESVLFMILVWIISSLPGFLYWWLRGAVVMVEGSQKNLTGATEIGKQGMHHIRMRCIKRPRRLFRILVALATAMIGSLVSNDSWKHLFGKPIWIWSYMDWRQLRSLADHFSIEICPQSLQGVFFHWASP